MDRRKFLLGAGTVATFGLGAMSGARADTLDEIKKRGTLIVGMEAAFVPYEYFDSGKIVGFDPDIAESFAAKLGVKTQLMDTEWAGVIPALYGKKFDCIISGMTMTAARAEKVLFSMPYADASSAIMIRKGDRRITTAADLSGKIVGVQLGGAAVGILETFEAKLKASGRAGYAGMKQYDHNPEAYEDLVNMRVDTVANSISSLMVVVRQSPGKFAIVPGISDIPAYFGMAFRKEDIALQTAANIHLAGMKADGSLSKLQEKWFGGTMPTPETIPSVLP